jgi:hypothetical protein
MIKKKNKAKYQIIIIIISMVINCKVIMGCTLVMLIRFLKKLNFTINLLINKIMMKKKLLIIFYKKNHRQKLNQINKQIIKKLVL